jgi:hypothetical protein
VSILSSITTSMSVFSQDLLSGPLGTHLAEKVPTGPFEMPLLIAKELDNPLVLPDSQAEYAAGVCQSGVDLDDRTFEGRDHVGLVTADSPADPRADQLDPTRLAGQPATSGC